MSIWDDRVCALGEGPLWHPERQELFWFDILGMTLHSKARSWTFDEYVSAAAWVDGETLLMASASGLWRFDIGSGERALLVPLEADNPVTRSNDGRADPFGGFWIGTMGINAEPGAGAIYRYFKGELRKIFSDITITNAISFSPDGETAYFTDTTTQKVMRQSLDSQDGWPVGTPEVHLDLTGEDLNPDGAVVDAAGNLWVAQWGASRVACYDKAGAFLHAAEVGAAQASCPAFGGPDLKTLFVTTAAVGDDAPDAGKTYAVSLDVQGQREHQVIL